MSEKAPSINPNAEQAVDFKNVEIRRRVNGETKGTGEVIGHGIRSVDEHGNVRVVSANDMLIARGYDPNDPTKSALDTDPVDTRHDEDLYEGYKSAVMGEETVRVKDPATGKMVEKNVKDLNFREWLKQSEERKAARWYSATRSHGEAPDEIHPDIGATEDDARRLTDKDHQERLNGQEGKENPSQDDIDYYRWLKSQQNGGEDGEGENGDDDKGGDDDKEDEPRMPTIEEVLAQDELYKEREEELNKARNRYAELTAKRRKISTFGIRGRGTSKKELDEAREAYETARNETGKHVAGRMKELEKVAEQYGIDMEPFNLAQYSMEGAIMELHTLEHEIVDERLEQADGKKLKRFYDWWARQGGGKFFSKHRMLGNLKKGLVVGALVAPGVILSPFLAAGVATGASVGLVSAGMVGVARGVARGHIDKNASAAELARKQSAEHIRQGEAQILEEKNRGIFNWQGEDTTERVEGHTKKEVWRNRRRLIGGVAIGALAPLAVDKIANAVGDINPMSKIMGDTPPKPPRFTDERYGSINNPRLLDRLEHGNFVTGSERFQAISRLKSVIGEDAYNQLGQEQREALLLLKDEQLDQAQEYLEHLAAGRIG